jgi:hypothetical protein
MSTQKLQIGPRTSIVGAAAQLDPNGHVDHSLQTPHDRVPRSKLQVAGVKVMEHVARFYKTPDFQGMANVLNERNKAEAEERQKRRPPPLSTPGPAWAAAGRAASEIINHSW